MITIFLILTFVLLLTYGVLAFLAWRKISIYLTYNTRYESAEYEKAITATGVRKPAAPASKTQQRGRSIKPVDDLVDFADLDFETAAKAIEEAGNSY